MISKQCVVCRQTNSQSQFLSSKRAGAVLSNEESLREIKLYSYRVSRMKMAVDCAQHAIVTNIDQQIDLKMERLQQWWKKKEKAKLRNATCGDPVKWQSQSRANKPIAAHVPLPTYCVRQEAAEQNVEKPSMIAHSSLKRNHQPGTLEQSSKIIGQRSQITIYNLVQTFHDKRISKRQQEYHHRTKLLDKFVDNYSSHWIAW